MAEINNSLDKTEEQVKKLESEVIGLEKELEVIPSTVINSDVALSSFFDNTTEQVKNFKNQLKSAGSGKDFNALTGELNTIKRNIEDIMSESSKIAIGAFDTSDSSSLKSELNEVVRTFNAVDINGTKVKDTIKSINPELGAVIEKAIYTTDLLETLMGFVTSTKLKDTTIQTDLAKGINLGMGDAKNNIESLKEQIDAQRKFLAETYPNGSQGLSDVKSRVVDEFFGAESELDAYNREVETLNNLEQKLAQTTADFAREQQEVNKALASNAQGDAMSKFKGYFDMYNVAYTTIGKLKQLSEVQDYLSNPFVFAEQSAEQLKASLEELIPKANEVKINSSQTQLKAVEDEAEALRSIADRQSELLSSSKYITEETKNRLTSEEQLNALIAQRKQFNTEQLGLASKLANMQNIDEAGKVLDLGKTADSNTFNAYMTQVEEAVKEVQTLRENLLQAQNTMNSTNVGTSPFTNIINSADVEKLEKFQQLFNNGLKINAEGSDLNYIKQLGMYLDSVREIAKNFKSELGPEVAARFQMFSNLSAVENEGRQFANSDNIVQQYINRARAIAQISSELEKLNSNKNNVLQNVDIGGANKYNKLINDLTIKLNTLNKKQAEVKDKMMSYGIDIPYTDKIRTSKGFDYSKNISHIETDSNGKQKTIYEYKELISEVEKIIKLFEQEAVAAEKAKQAEETDKEKQHQQAIKDQEKAYEELRNKVSEVMSSIKHAISNVIGVIRTANNILHKVGITIVSVFNGAIRTVQRIIQLFGNLGNRIGLANKHTNILKGSFTELKSAIDLLAGALNKLFNNQFIEQGRKLLSSIQSLKMLMGNDLTTATIEWANQMEDAFGLSANELITNLREVTAVMYGLGMSAKDVQVGARNLESVGMVLSSISGLDFETVMTKIQSGMKGMTQAIDDLGLSVRESQMDAYLKKLKAQGGEFANISTSFSQLNEQQRVYVRYAAIMDQFMTKEAYTVENYAKALRTTTGSINVLTSQLNGLKSSIGTLALGLFSKVLQPLIYIVYYIRQLIIQLGTFLGIKMKLDANMNGGGGVDTTPIEEETDALDEMTDAANKAKGALDELDHISTMSSSSGGGKGTGSDFDYSSLIGGYDFADALAEYDANFIEECKQRLIDMVEHLLNRITEFIKEFTGRVISWKTIKENLDAVWTHVKSIFYNILNIAKTTFGIISGLIYDVFNDLGFTTLLKKLTGVLTTFTFGVDTMLKRIAPYITKFYNKYLAGYVRKFGELLSDKLDWLQEKANAFAEKWLNMDDATLEAKMDALGEKFKNLLGILKEIAILFKTIFGKDTDTDNTFFNDNASENMKKFKETAEKLHEVLSSLWDIIKGIAHEIADVNDDGVVDSKDFGVVIDKINEKLERVKTWLSENKEEIISLVEKVAETLGKLAETKFDLLMTVLEFITENADLINSVLDTIQKILDFVSEHPALSFGIAIGVQLAGHVIKTAATALIWKTILGTGSGGGLATAVSGIWGSISTKIGALATSIGSAIKNGITGAISGINWSAVASSIPPLTLAVTFAAGTVESLKVFAEDIIGKDGIKWKNDWTFDGTLDSGTLQKQADAYYKVLRDNFGYEIPRIAIDNAVEMARQQLEASGKYTAEQIDRMVAIVEEDIYEDIEHPIHNLANTGDWDAITNHVSVVDVEMTSLKDTFETTSESAVKSLDEITYQFDDIEQASSTSLNNINSNVTTLDSLISGTANNVSSSISLIELAASRASSAVQSFSNAFKELFSSNIAEKLRELADIKINIGNFGVGANLINGTKTTNVKGFKGYANGGLPSTGSLFMANEDGNTELVGNFGGYSGVANQSMIISAMESAVYNAVTQALKANSGNGGQTTIEVCKGGVFVGDEAGIRKLANQINNVNATGRTNIANVGFSMT